MERSRKKNTFALFSQFNIIEEILKMSSSYMLVFDLYPGAAQFDIDYIPKSTGQLSVSAKKSVVAGFTLEAPAPPFVQAR